MRVLLLAAVCFTGCQTYVFEPVGPITFAAGSQRELRFARLLKPNVMLLVDRSGSMDQPLNPADPACQGCGPSSPCPATCPTRMSELRAAMAAFLGGTGQTSRLGLTAFPTDSQCGAPTSGFLPEVALPGPSVTDEGTEAQLAANAAQITKKINELQPMGGTPTAAALASVGALPGLNDAHDARSDIILLLTDGLPNCNESNPNHSCSGASASCRCTLATCISTHCATGCLDEDATVAAIRSLSIDRHIQTAVLGFGAELGQGGDAPGVLQAMGEAGRMWPTCPNGTDAECGTGNTCDVASRACSKRYFEARNRAELERAFHQIIDPSPGNVCEFKLLETPSNEAYLAVRVDGQLVPRGPDTWTYDAAAATVTFSNASATCVRLRAASPLNPVDVSIRYLQEL